MVKLSPHLQYNVSLFGSRSLCLLGKMCGSPPSFDTILVMILGDGGSSWGEREWRTEVSADVRYDFGGRYI